MRLILNEQDVIDAVCVWIAARDNDGDLSTASPEDVKNVELTHDNGRFSAIGTIYRYDYPLREQDIINAVAVFLRAYHSFDEDRLRVKLTFDANQFGADAIVV
jgi:hypothetical protein